MIAGRGCCEIVKFAAGRRAVRCFGKLFLRAVVLTDSVAVAVAIANASVNKSKGNSNKNASRTIIDIAGRLMSSNRMREVVQYQKRRTLRTAKSFHGTHKQFLDYFALVAG